MVTLDQIRPQTARPATAELKPSVSMPITSLVPEYSCVETMDENRNLKGIIGGLRQQLAEKQDKLEQQQRLIAQLNARIRKLEVQAW